MRIRTFVGVCVAVALLAPLAAEAQAPRRAFELGVFGGYRIGGEILQEDNDFFPVDVDVDDSVAYGIRLEIPVSEWVAIELLASRQPTEFIEDDDLFGPDTSLLDAYVHRAAAVRRRCVSPRPRPARHRRRPRTAWSTPRPRAPCIPGAIAPRA